MLLSRYTASLTEAVASGPYFKVMVANLLPYQIMQPWVDAAFKKRGIDPEDFWRSAGLPEFRFPDPNGTRFPNGAPPPARRCWRAPRSIRGRRSRPDHRAPTRRRRARLPRPGQPAALRGCRPIGPVRSAPDFPSPLDVQTSPPKPDGLPPTPGIPIAGRPGETAPAVPGTPVPLPPSAPPGHAPRPWRRPARRRRRRRSRRPAAGPASTTGTGAAAAGPVFITPGGTGGSNQ